MILLIDTAGSSLRLAIATNDGSLRECIEAVPSEAERTIHDARLADECAKLLERTNVQPDQIEKIGVVIGPGSFTGLRIGLAFAKGFAMATTARLVPVVRHAIVAKAVNDIGQATHSAQWIVTPAYRTESLFAAPFDSPEDVRLVARDALTGTKLEEEELGGNERMTAMARIVQAARNRTADEAALQLVELEPLYLVDFVPNAGLERL